MLRERFGVGVEGTMSEVRAERQRFPWGGRARDQYDWQERDCFTYCPHRDRHLRREGNERILYDWMIDSVKERPLALYTSGIVDTVRKNTSTTAPPRGFPLNTRVYDVKVSLTPRWIV